MADLCPARVRISLSPGSWWILTDLLDTEATRLESGDQAHALTGPGHPADGGHTAILRVPNPSVW